MYIQQGLNAGRIGRVRSRLQGELRRPRDERHVLGFWSTERWPGHTVSGRRRDRWLRDRRVLARCPRWAWPARQDFPFDRRPRQARDPL